MQIKQHNQNAAIKKIVMQALYDTKYHPFAYIVR